VAWEFNMAMRGYSRREVDELLARVVANQATASEVRQARFSKQTRGYAPRDVDAAIAEILENLENLDQRNRPPTAPEGGRVAWAFTLATPGYSRREVDELLARVVAKQATLSEVREARFSKQLRGYAPSDVDAALSEIQQELEQ
jgi:DivIVA domain-containing protein